MCGSDTYEEEPYPKYRSMGEEKSMIEIGKAKNINNKIKVWSNCSDESSDKNTPSLPGLRQDSIQEISGWGVGDYHKI